MTMTRTDKIVAALLAFCAAIAVVAAFANKAEAADYSGFKMAEFKIEIEGEQKTTWHRTVEAPDECSTSDHSFGREILHFETKEPIYLTATHMPGEFNPMMFSAKQIEFPAVAKVERNFTPVVGKPAKECEDNGGGAEVTPPDCGTKTIKNWAVDLQYAEKKKNALLLSGSSSVDDPYVNCPGDSLDTFPWLIVERSGHKGNYIYAEVTQDELFDPNFQKWIAIGHGKAKDRTKSEWSSTEITYSVSFKRIDK